MCKLLSKKVVRSWAEMSVMMHLSHFDDGLEHAAVVDACGCCLVGPERSSS